MLVERRGGRHAQDHDVRFVANKVCGEMVTIET